MSTSLPTPEAPPGPPAASTHEGELNLGAFARQRLRSLREGELGSLPIVVGIIVIAIYFQSRNSNFLTSGNFVNLIARCRR
jgi:ABC-type xylose transport system permease subunit